MNAGQLLKNNTYTCNTHIRVYTHTPYEKGVSLRVKETWL